MVRRLDTPIGWRSPSARIGHGDQNVVCRSSPMAEPEDVLSAKELIHLVRQRWRASYDMRLVQRQGRLYFQVMWGHLEQQSFPLSEAVYAERVAEVVATVNELGAAKQVRTWLETTRDKPRIGRALSLALLAPSPRLAEFLL